MARLETARQVVSLVDLSSSLRAIRERWWIVVAAVLLAAGVTFLITPAQPAATVTASYRATATLLQGENSQGYANQTQLERVALFATTGEIPRLVAEELGYNGDPAILAAQITPQVAAVVGTVTLSSTGTDGDRIAEVVNAFADQTVDYFAAQAIERRNAELTALEERLVEISGLVAEAEARAAQDPADVLLAAELQAQQQRYEQVFVELQDARAQSTEYADLVILQRATPIPVSADGGFVAPSSRNARVGLAAGLGLVLGLLLALMLERANARIRTREDVTQALGVPVIAEVPQMSRKESRDMGIAVVTTPLHSISDAYRNARSAVLLTTGSLAATGNGGRQVEERLTTENAPEVVLVTSGHAKEGKSTTVANLAASFAETGRTVLVLDADFRAPKMNVFFDVPEGIGLSEFLTDPTNLSLDRLARPTNVPGVRLLEAGMDRTHPAVLASQLGSVIAAARELADIVLVDTAPILHANDTLDIIPLVDRVVLVARSGRLTASAGQRMLDFLRRLQAPVAGVVLIGSTGAQRPGYGYGYGYSGSSDGAKSKDTVRHSKSAAAAAARSAKGASTPPAQPSGPAWLPLLDDDEPEDAAGDAAEAADENEAEDSAPATRSRRPGRSRSSARGRS